MARHHAEQDVKIKAVLMVLKKFMTFKKKATESGSKALITLILVLVNVKSALDQTSAALFLNVMNFFKNMCTALTFTSCSASCRAA